MAAFSSPLIHYLAGIFNWSPSQLSPPSHRSIVVSSHCNLVFVAWGKELFCASIPLLLDLGAPNLDVVELERGTKKPLLQWFSSTTPVHDLYISPGETIIVATFEEVVYFFETLGLPQKSLDQVVIWTVHNPRLQVRDVVWVKDVCYILWSDGGLMATQPQGKCCQLVLMWPDAVRLSISRKRGMIYLVSADDQICVFDTQTGQHIAEFTLPSGQSERLIRKNGTLVTQAGENIFVWDVAGYKGKLVQPMMTRPVFLEEKTWGPEFVSVAWDDLNSAIFAMRSDGCLVVFVQVAPCLLSSLKLTPGEIEKKAQSIAVIARVKAEIRRMEDKVATIQAGFDYFVGVLDADMRQMLMGFMHSD